MTNCLLNLRLDSSPVLVEIDIIIFLPLISTLHFVMFVNYDFVFAGATDSVA